MAYIRLVLPEEARGLLKTVYDQAIARAGRVFNIVRTMSSNPAVLDASMQMYLRVMKGPSALSRREREMLATVVSATNGCHYWIVEHGKDFRSEGGDEGTAGALETDYRTAALSPRERALCDYAVRLTRDPRGISEADLKPLRDLGLTDAEIHDAVQVIAYFNYINRVADGLGTDMEADAPP